MVKLQKGRLLQLIYINHVSNIPPAYNPVPDLATPMLQFYVDPEFARCYIAPGAAPEGPGPSFRKEEEQEILRLAQKWSSGQRTYIASAWGVPDYRLSQPS